MPKGSGTLVLLLTFKFEQIKIVKSWLILPCWIRIRILNVDTDPDPADQNKCGSVRIRIRNNGTKYLRFRLPTTNLIRLMNAHS